MKESMSNALILNIIIIFLFIFIILFAGSTAYTKAFKVKNRIISIIERNETIVLTKGINNSSVITEINSALADAGYTIVMNNDVKCKDALDKRFGNLNQTYNVVNTGTNSYRYCIAEFYDQTSPMHGKYYAVIAYMYFEIPLINQKLEFPVYGETKTMGIAY